jgi:hypothetical protein
MNNRRTIAPKAKIRSLGAMACRNRGTKEDCTSIWGETMIPMNGMKRPSVNSSRMELKNMKRREMKYVLL